MKVFNIVDAKRPMVTIVCGIIGTIIGSFQIIYYFENFLIVLGVIIAPFAGVMIADYWIVGKGKADLWAPVKNVNWTGMIALALGVLTSFLVKVGIAGLNGIIVSMVAYLVLYRIMPKPEKLNIKELE